MADDALTAGAALPDRRPASADAELELSEDEGNSLALFLALDTQWRRHPMTGMRLGVDYAAIEPTARMLEIDVTPRRLADIRVMEAAALAALA